ncbi:phospholipase-like, aminotransferase-like mobile domain protein, partial [Tanacetum coccineum]
MRRVVGGSEVFDMRARTVTFVPRLEHVEEINALITTARENPVIVASKSREASSLPVILDDMVRVGHSMGYNLDGCLKDMERIIGSQGDEDILLVAGLTAPQQPGSKRALWDFLSNLVRRWNGEAIIMGDFNDVRTMDERLGSSFNASSARCFDRFTCVLSGLWMSIGRVPSYRGRIPPASKMSKLDQLFDGGFDSMGEHAVVPIFAFVVPNAMVRFKKKLQDLKFIIRLWVKDKKFHLHNAKNSLQNDLISIDKDLERGNVSDDILLNRMELNRRYKILNLLEVKDLVQKSKNQMGYPKGDEILNSSWRHLRITLKFDFQQPWCMIDSKLNAPFIIGYLGSGGRADSLLYASLGVFWSKVDSIPKLVILECSTALSALMEYTATIHVRSKLHYFKLINDRLNEDRRTLFRTTCFGPWLDMTYVENDDGMIHYVLQKQCFSDDDDSFDLPLIYNVNGHSLHFGRREFCLVTALKFGLLSFREYRNGDIPFRNRLFPEKIGYDVKIINVLALLEDEEKFSKVSDEDAIRVCLLLSLEVIFRGRELVSVVGDVFLRMVNNLDAWNSFSWGGLYGQYLNKRSAARAGKKKSSEEFHTGVCGREKGREAALIDHVRNLKGICKTLLTLPKEVKSLRGRIFKLKSIIQASLYPTRGFGKEETLKKVGPQIEDFLQTTSEDEPNIKDDTSPKEVVYCCDDNGDAPLCFMPAKHHYKYTYSSKQEDQIIRLVDQRQQDDISNMAEVAEQKIQSEIQRLYNHREAKLNKIVEVDKQRKCIGHMNSSAHMKLAVEK